MRYRLLDAAIPDAEIAAVIGLLRENLAAVSQEAVRAIETEVPEYVRPHDPRYREVLSMTVEWSNGRFLDLMEDDETPLDDLLAFFHGVGAGEAREGRSSELWQTAFRVGTGVSIKRFTEIAESRSTVSAPLIGRIAQQVLTYQNEIMRALLAGHNEAGGRTVEELQQRRRDLADLVLAAEPSPGRVRELALDVGWPLPSTVAAVALHPGADGGARRPAVPADALSGLHRSEPCLVVGDPDGPGRRAALETGLRGWVAAVGPTVPVAEAARSLTWARRALDLALRRGDTAPVNALDHVPDLLILRDRDLLDDLANALLAPLAEVRSQQRRRLAETLLAFLECGFNAAEAAQRLGIHAQTVRYRVRRLDDLFGPVVRQPARHLELQLALRHWLMGSAD